MATPNFARPQNASKYFVVLTGQDTAIKKCNECGAIHYEWEDDLADINHCKECESDDLEETTEYVYPQDWEYDDLKDNIGNEIEAIGGSSLDEAIGHDRSYHRQALGTLTADKYFGDINVELEIKVLVQSAYYEGATLDYLISIYNGGEMIEVEDGYYKTTVEDILEDLFETKYSEHGQSDMNKGMRTIQSRYAKDWLEQQITDLSEQVEKILENYSQHKLNCAGVFSNGEAIYTKAD